MVRVLLEEKTVPIPQGVKVTLEGKVAKVQGPLGTLTRDFSHAPVQIAVEGEKITVFSSWARRKERAMVGTIRAHLQNMMRGVTEGFTYHMKVVISHFPVTVKVQKDQVLVENFIGERSPRRAQIKGSTKVLVKGEDILIRGIDLEEVSQTAANIQRATKIKKKDPRVFLDGIYVQEKRRGIEG